MALAAWLVQGLDICVRIVILVKPCYLHFSGYLAVPGICKACLGAVPHSSSPAYPVLFWVFTLGLPISLCSCSGSPCDRRLYQWCDMRAVKFVCHPCSNAPQYNLCMKSRCPGYCSCHLQCAVLKCYRTEVLHVLSMSPLGHALGVQHEQCNIMPLFTWPVVTTMWQGSPARVLHRRARGW